MSQRKFFKMLGKVSFLKRYWDEKRGDLLIDELNEDIGLMSLGERVMVQFFVSVWDHNNKRYGFDLVYAMQSIDEENQKIIAEWVLNPYYP